MELYTLNSNFGRTDVVEDAIDVIWTERYSSAGDCLVKVPDSAANRVLLSEGTFVSTSASVEPGVIESLEAEAGILTAKGPLLTKFLRNRAVRYSKSNVEQAKNLTGTPAAIAIKVVADNCVAGGANIVGSPSNLPATYMEVIQGLAVGATPSGGTSTTIAVGFTNVYDEVAKICATYDLGFRMYPDVVNSNGTYTLVFEVYVGRDLTREQSVHPVVAFSSVLDSLMNVKELRSIEGYRNVCYAYSPQCDPQALWGLDLYGSAEFNGGFWSINFDRRVLHLIVEDVTPDSVGSDSAKYQAVMNERAASALANNNYVRMLDGQLVPQLALKYGDDYLLGDIVELNDPSGLAQYARITEHISAQSPSGEVSYPTLSIVSK